MFDKVTYQKEYAPSYYRKNREKLILLMRTYGQVNKTKIAERKHLWYRNNKQRIRLRDARSNYGISVEEYKTLHDKQKGCCKICEKPEGERSLAVDHNHRTEKIRGLLCINCNAALGHMRDSKALLRRAINYLKEYDRG